MALNDNKKKYRKAAGLTQKTLASKSGLSFSMSPTRTIEDQIDEYLDYKRGLNKNLSRPASDLKGRRK